MCCVCVCRASRHKVEADLSKSFRREGPILTSLPKAGRPAAELKRAMTADAKKEDKRWEDGLVSGAVYHGEKVRFALRRLFCFGSFLTAVRSAVFLHARADRGRGAVFICSHGVDSPRRRTNAHHCCR